MRTNIEIDDKLMEEAMTASELVTTKKAVVEQALKMWVRASEQQRALNALWGIAKDDRGWDPAPPKWEKMQKMRAKARKAGDRKAA